MKFQEIPYHQVPWAELDRYDDRTFCQRRHWINFICETQNGRPIVARLVDVGNTVGYFTGVIVRKFGMRVMGSPFPGWTTPFMGFNLQPGVPRMDAVRALIPFVFRELGCIHLELNDPQLIPSDVEPFGFSIHRGTTFVSDLSMSEDELFGRMKSACRRCIRKAAKSSVIVEQAAPDGFAEDYYNQLSDVFAKQNLRPTYDQDRVASLIRNVHPSGDLLLLRARDEKGRSIATGIFPGFGNTSLFWGNASLRQFQQVRPNEAIHWHAMRYWKDRGVVSHFWGGGGDYKEKYGGTRVETTHYRLSRLRAIGLARDAAYKLYYLPRQLKREAYLRLIGRRR